MRRKFPTLVTFGIGVVLGPALLKLLGAYNSLRFDPSFNFGNVITALTTLLVGGLLASHLQRRSQSDRSEKELLLRQLDQLLLLLADFEKFKEGGVLTEISAALKKISMKVHAIGEILRTLRCPRHVIKAINFEPSVKAIRKLSTETPIRKIETHAASAKCDSEVRDGIIKLAAEKKSLLDTKVEDLKTRVIKAQLTINRM